MQKFVSEQQQFLKNIKKEMAGLETARPYLKFIEENNISINIVDTNSRRFAYVKNGKIEISRSRYNKLRKQKKSERETLLAVIPTLVHELDHIKRGKEIKHWMYYHLTEEELLASWAGIKVHHEIFTKYKNKNRKYSNTQMDGALLAANLFYVPREARHTLKFAIGDERPIMDLYANREILESLLRERKGAKLLQKIATTLLDKKESDSLKRFYRPKLSKFENERLAWIKSIRSKDEGFEFRDHMMKMTGKLVDQYRLYLLKEGRALTELEYGKVRSQISVFENIISERKFEGKDWLIRFRKRNYPMLLDSAINIAKKRKGNKKLSESYLKEAKGYANMLGFTGHEYNILLKQYGFK